MTLQENMPQAFDDEIDLRELFLVLWDGKVWISAITAAAAAISVFVALSLPNIYESKALLAPKSDGGSGGLSRLAAQYGGLASLAGMLGIVWVLVRHYARSQD